MAKAQHQEQFETTINRWYIDTRPYVPQPHNIKASPTLPLLQTLQKADQEKITRFLRPADKFMSLASALLKYTFIHRRAKIPWKEVQISRTPAPHGRPYWEPQSGWSTTDIYDDTDPIFGEPRRIRGLEYNVSHQAGLVAMIGCSTPTPQLPSSVVHTSLSTTHSGLDALADIDLNTHPTCTAFDSPDVVRLGVDIACTNEDKRTPKDVTNQAKFDEWVEIFAEMFSERERRHMRGLPIYMPAKEREEGDSWSNSSSSSPNSSPRSGVGQYSEAKMIGFKLRRFYAYWSLKEAYIKMVGEGLLASWLRELEFLNVRAPQTPASSSHGAQNHSSTIRQSSGHPPIIPEESTKGGNQAAHGNNTHEQPESIVLPLDMITRHRRDTSVSNSDMYAQRRPSVSAAPPRTTNPISPPPPPNYHNLQISGSTPSEHHPEPSETAKWTPPNQAEKQMTTLLRGRRVEDIRLEIVAYDDDFMISTAMRGVKEREVRFDDQGSVVGEGSGWWLRLDFERDIRPCAEGRCSCLEL